MEMALLLLTTLRREQHAVDKFALKGLANVDKGKLSTS
jgi:hypothetical protein